MFDYLVIDIGSTYTKQRVFKDYKLMASAATPTTLENVYLGIRDGQKLLCDQLNISEISAKHVLSSSSAAGGLRMVAMGYMARVTGKAAAAVAMNSGAKILEIISSENPPEYRIEILKEIMPDIILLAGGTDYGDETSIVENAHLIVQSNVKSMVLIAGNVAAQSKVAKILKEGSVPYVRVPNIMPTIHKLLVDDAREAIHREFIKQITKAKGLDVLTTQITNDKIIPTPGAVLLASEILARGVDENEGIGDILVIDLGGATTDVHSVIPEYEDMEDEEIGLVVGNYRQMSFRTVEGNLGMRVSATGVTGTVSPRMILAKNGIKDDEITEQFANYCEMVEENTRYLPQNKKEYDFDTMLAQTAVEVAIKRHAGYIATTPDPVTGVRDGMPIGRDLRNVKTVIAVGGMFANRDKEESESIIRNAFKNKGISLLPTKFNVIIDKNYILYTGGVIAQVDKNYGFNVLKDDFKL